MNSLEKHLLKLEAGLYSKFQETKKEVRLLLGNYSYNFPTYTDHSIEHTDAVFLIASELLSDEEIENLNSDEIYILSMACLLHDVGMCIPEEKIQEISNSKDFISYKESHPNLNSEEFIRDIHHQLSNKFITEEWELLKIPTKKYAKAIGLVAEGHRKVDLGNFDKYEPQFFAKSGKEYVCLPYLACILRIADELDVTNSRTPKILTKYYMPNNEVSIREWQKHIATSQRNCLENKVIFEVDCSDQNIYAALQEQFDKIQNVIYYCQKIIRAIPFSKVKQYTLFLSLVEVKYNNIGFDPKGIKFSFDVQNVVTAFIGEDLYKDQLTSLREAIQNSIDSCRYKSKVLKDDYTPYIKVFVDDNFLRIEDNAAGMDEFIIENFFGRLASSFYEQEKIKNQFEAIGQFGVGVFSYFLLSEYIDIETKTSNSDTLKFRFDKDPKSYFHFYDKTERSTVGTTITMYFKKELIGEFKFSQIEDYIKKIFKHIEIPIEVNGFENHSIVESLPFELNEQKEINNRLKLQHKKVIEHLKCIQVHIDDEEIEGNCAIIITKSYLDAFSNLYSYFDSENFNSVSNHRSTSQISISQKGVFVNNYPSSKLNFMVGEVNLKKKVKINIDRNEFTDEKQIYALIQRFELEILKQVFDLINEECHDNEKLVKISNDFFSNYAIYYRYGNSYENELASLLKKSLYIKAFINARCFNINIGEFIENHSEFIFISDREDYELIHNHFKKPIVIANGMTYEGSYNYLRYLFTQLCEFTPTVQMIENNAYEFLSIEIKDELLAENIRVISEILNNSYSEVIKIDSPQLLISIWRNKIEFKDEYIDDTFCINYNHPFIQFIINNSEKIIGNNVTKKIIRSAFAFIFEINNREQKIADEPIFRLNEILMPLNEISPIHKFTIADFQSRLLEISN